MEVQVKKRGSIEDRMAKLRLRIEQLTADGVVPSGASARRMLAGTRAALHVMKKARDAGRTDYCKERDDGVVPAADSGDSSHNGGS